MKYLIFADRKEKAYQFSVIFRQYLNGRVLDVGCGEKYLSKYVGNEYVGVDLRDTADVKVNLEEGLPFRERSFETVIALDSLEHLENIHRCLRDIFKISKKFVILGFPNIYYWRWRLRFLMGKSISEKYKLPIKEPVDRHRWIYTFENIYEMVKYLAAEQGFRMEGLNLMFFRYSSLIGRIVAILARKLAHLNFRLFSAGFIFVLSRE